MILLQSIQPNAEDISKLSKASIELAEAASNYGALKVIFGVFMIMVLIIMLMFIYQMWISINKLNNISKACEITQEYFNQLSNKTIGLEESIAIVEASVEHIDTLVKYYIIKIRLENNIDNKDMVSRKASRLIQNCIAEEKELLSKFDHEGKPLSIIMETSSLEDSIYALLCEQIYVPKDEFSIASMEQSVYLFMNGIRLETITKIKSI